MKVLYNGKEVGEIISNHSMDDDSAIKMVLGLDQDHRIDDIMQQDRLSELSGHEYIYIDSSDGSYQVDIDGFTFEY